MAAFVHLALEGICLSVIVSRRTCRLRRHTVRAFSRNSGEDSEKDQHDERLLVTPAWLATRLEDVSVLDVRGAVRKLGRTFDDEERYFQEVEYVGLRDDYVDAHIENAAFVDWTRDIVDEHSGDLYNIKGRDEFIQVMEEKGVNEKRTVVIYDNGDMLYAARLWFGLVLYGHSDVRLLNGGFRRWNDEGYPTTPDAPCALKLYTSFEPPETLETFRSCLDDIRRYDKSSTTLIDARSAQQFHGIERRAEYGGHISGAINLDRRLLMADDGRGFHSPSDLRKVLTDHNVDLHRPIIAYCNGGVASAAVLFALHLLGVPLSQLSNYDGSWNEYGSHPPSFSPSEP